MNKALVILTILVVSGLLLGGAFLFNGVASVGISELGFAKVFGSVSADHYCNPPPGYPTNCN